MPQPFCVGLLAHAGEDAKSHLIEPQRARLADASRRARDDCCCRLCRAVRPHDRPVHPGQTECQLRIDRCAYALRASAKRPSATGRRGAAANRQHASVTVQSGKIPGIWRSLAAAVPPTELYVVDTGNAVVRLLAP